MEIRYSYTLDNRAVADVEVEIYDGELVWIIIKQREQRRGKQVNAGKSKFLAFGYIQIRIWAAYLTR